MEKGSFTFLVSYCGVVISLMGELAHGFPPVGAWDAMKNGDRVKSRPMSTGKTMRNDRVRILDITQDHRVWLGGKSSFMILSVSQLKGREMVVTLFDS